MIKSANDRNIDYKELVREGYDQCVNGDAVRLLSCQIGKVETIKLYAKTIENRHSRCLAPYHGQGY